jgi:SAM-dependent methyltransferase
MGVSTGGTRGTAEREVIWHDLECGGYTADLPLWLELAGAADGRSPADPLLEIGAGSGRVTLALAQAGHRVTAVDLDSRLLRALGARASGMDVEVVCADARTLALGRADFGLCLVPMQTVQLLGGSDGRAAFMHRARAHLRPGGVLACAIVSDFECFDCTHGEGGPTPEVARVGDSDYVSRAIRVAGGEDSFVIERVRSVAPARAKGAASPATGIAGERDVIELDVVTVKQLQREGASAGFRPGEPRRVDATDEHLASEVVILHA